MGSEPASPGCAWDDNGVLFKRAALTPPSVTHFALSRSRLPPAFFFARSHLFLRCLSSFDHHECQREVQRSGGKEREGEGVAPPRIRQ
ncbi:hypothetical protein GW17_00008859 [Ensete ventricosum]|nr:hypothetical protein GW17_00008859 [Ensete ventricosum]RZR84514.1 hypothetical protein BHM03_00011364 [Ensete ventricosum]